MSRIRGIVIGCMFCLLHGMLSGQEVSGSLPGSVLAELLLSDTLSGSKTPVLLSRRGCFYHSSPVFSPGFDRIFWAARTGDNPNLQIYRLHVAGGEWQGPEPVPFSGRYNDDNPALSPDGSRLFFASDRPRDRKSRSGDWNIWVMNLDGTGRSEPVPVSAHINTAMAERCPCVTQNGSLYFTRIEGAQEYLYCSELKDGEYSEAYRLDSRVNPGCIDVCACLPPDERFLLLEKQEGEVPGIYISYPLDDGGWSEPRTLGLGWSRFPGLTPDGRFLFYMTRDGIFRRETASLPGFFPE